MKFTSLVLLWVVALTSLHAADPWYFGSWQDINAPEDLLHFEADRCVIKDPSARDPIHACAEYGRDECWLRSSRGSFHLVFKKNGDRFEIVSPASGIYRRLAAIPQSLQIVALPIPRAKPVSAERKAAISTEAAARLAEDQAVRTNQARRADMGTVDADNTAWIKAVIAEVGWPDASRFGRQTASAMFLFVQHSGDLPLMLGALPCIERDLKAKTCDPQDYALLFDRVQMMTGHPQRYGSQIVGDRGKQVVFLLENKAKVEQFRAAIGLFPLTTYLQVFEQSGAGKVGFMDSIRFSE